MPKSSSGKSGLPKVNGVPTTDRQTLWIDGPLPGLNETIGAATRLARTKDGRRLHSGYTDLKAAWGRQVHACALEQHLRPVKRARFIFTWYEEHRRRDKDNITVGQKYVFDGLQCAGVLTNDGWKEVTGIEHRWVVAFDRPGVRVEIIPT